MKSWQRIPSQSYQGIYDATDRSYTSTRQKTKLAYSQDECTIPDNPTPFKSRIHEYRITTSFPYPFSSHNFSVSSQQSRLPTSILSATYSFTPETASWSYSICRSLIIATGRPYLSFAPGKKKNNPLFKGDPLSVCNDDKRR